MKITYLNPKRVPLEKVPAGWMLKTALHPMRKKSYRFWIIEANCFTSATIYWGSEGSNTYITKLDLPPEYLFDFDGTGLSFADPNYRAAVEKEKSEGKVIEFNATEYPDNSGWVIMRSHHEFDWSGFKYRIHPKHAAEYGLSAEKIAMMEGKPTVPAGLPPFPLLAKPGFHFEYRTPEQAKGNYPENWWLLEGKEWIKCGICEEDRLRGTCKHYLELVPDAQPEQSDLDDPEYWRARQDDLRVQWARDPEMKREAWFQLLSSWMKWEGKNWISFKIYRPAPKPKSQEEIDINAFDEWFINNADRTIHHGYARKSWLAALAYARKGGAK